jgi:2-keto-4-pentenoate hydratase/2-oxohepta-3-ene-1,7-dioic acid hydratase in catechol pathway
MKLATILHSGRSCVSIVDTLSGVFWPLANLHPELPPSVTADMVAAIAHFGRVAEAGPPTSPGHPLSGAKVLAPIAAPPHNIMCVGKNYRAHAHEFTRSGFDAGAKAEEAIPDYPIIFTKPASAIIGPDEAIPLWDGLDAAVDYEAELAVVIGRGGRAIPRDRAFDHVFGYTILNDVTARDLQRRHKQWFLGKGIDGFAPMGPWIVTADEIDGGALRVSCRVNGAVRQDATTADLIFDIPTLIEVISRSVTLSPGDIIATGTPEGVGIGFDPPRFLADGDSVEVEISGIGVLRNRVQRVAAEGPAARDPAIAAQ